MEDLDLVALVIPVLFPVLAGWVAARAHVLAAADAKVLTWFFLYISAPALLIAVLSREDSTALFQPRYIAATALLMLFQYGLLFSVHRCLLKRPPEMSALAAFTGAKYNAVVLGLPILLAALGHKAIGAVVVNLLVGYLTILPVTLTILELARSVDSGVGSAVAGGVKRALRSVWTYPLVMATVIGLALSETGWRLPGWLDVSLSKLGAAATPTALVAVGLMISSKAFRSHRTEVVLMSLFRVVVSPAMAIGLALLLRLPPVAAIALAVSFSLPTAKMVFALAESHETYSEEAADIILVTTLSVIAVFPAVLWTCEQLWPGAIMRH